MPMSPKTTDRLLIVWRALTFMSALLTPFIFSLSMGIYHRLEDHQNRLIQMEVQFKDQQKAHDDLLVDYRAKVEKGLNEHALMWSHIYLLEGRH